MATDSKPTDPPADPPANDDPEAGFWAKLDERIDAGISRGIEKHVKPGTSRNGGRTTLPGVLADLMFGKQADKS
jgi:hypothetical protein